MTAPPSGLGRRTVTGTPFETGLALGLAGRDAVHRAVVPSALWQRVTAPAEAPAIARMDQATRALFPAVHDELRGLAEGLDLPFQQVLAWNARGDLLAGAGEGCTTVMAPGRTPVIAHNEDGLPTLRGACFLAELQPAKHPRVMSFCYPGSIPGHSFAVTAAGLVITVNNLRLTGIAAEIPRMVLTRALLAAPDRAAAVALLRHLAAHGARLLYHGDFDWGGVAIARTLAYHVDWLPWRYDADAYVAALRRGGDALPMLSGAPQATPWDARLAEVMRKRGTSVEEEVVVDELIGDLEAWAQR